MDSVTFQFLIDFLNSITVTFPILLSVVTLPQTPPSSYESPQEASLFLWLLRGVRVSPSESRKSLTGLVNYLSMLHHPDREREFAKTSVNEAMTTHTKILTIWTLSIFLF
jgi:hypothetical protein